MIYEQKLSIEHNGAVVNAVPVYDHLLKFGEEIPST